MWVWSSISRLKKEIKYELLADYELIFWKCTEPLFVLRSFGGFFSFAWQKKQDSEITVIGHYKCHYFTNVHLKSHIQADSKSELVIA